MSANLVGCSQSEVDRIYQRFQMVVPAEKCKYLPDILNAYWRGFHDTHLWAELPEVRQRTSTLSELVLKNIEVFEFEQILGEERQRAEG